MNLTATTFFNSLRGKKVAFLGLGVTNNDNIRMFAGRGITTIVCDKNEEDRFDPALLAELRALGAELRLGPDYLDKLDMDIVFRAPGVYFNLPRLREYREQGGIVTSELEVFLDLCPCPVIGVTGSDGKTTTTTLITEMLRKTGKTVHLGGNIGRALLPMIFDIKPQDYAAVELSSFQLISMRRSPDIAVVKNVTPNHLDVHGTMEEYTDAKRNIFAHQNAFGLAVLNADDPVTSAFAGDTRGVVRFFSLTKQVVGAWLREDGMLCRQSRTGETEALFHRDDIKLPGLHNVENYLTAIAAVDAIVPAEAMHAVAREFGGVEHRMELVREYHGVKWYNDSIASSPTRVIAGLRAFTQKIIVIAGGYDKKIPYEPLAPDVLEHVKLLILMGATADKIEAAVKGHPDYSEGNPRILRAESMEDAVAIARREALPGDIVALSPASASFDMYPNFEVRGRHFKELVGKL